MKMLNKLGKGFIFMVPKNTTMYTLSVPYHGQVYQFDYFSTTINKENIVFLMTKDQEAVRMLKADHFFMTMDITCPGVYHFNAIAGTRDEVEFKDVIAEMVMRRFLILACSGFMN